MDLKQYDESEVCATGYTIYYTTHHLIEQMAERSPEQALEFYLAVSRYNFYGEYYNGTDFMVKYLFEQQVPLIDKQREKYAKAKQGGRNGESIPFETILATIGSGQYTTLVAVGEALGTSGQNIGKRLKARGMDFKELVRQAQLQHPEANETKRLSVGFGETNPTNTYTYTYNSENETNEPSVSGDPKAVPEPKIGGGKGSISDMLI